VHNFEGLGDDNHLMCALVCKVWRIALYSCYNCNLRGSGHIMLPADASGQ